MSIAAWIGAILVGLTLGLLGSGGSILSVPILVYLVDQPEKVAIAGSLGIVGGIALVGAITAAVQRKVDGKTVALFGLHEKQCERKLLAHPPPSIACGRGRRERGRFRPRLNLGGPRGPSPPWGYRPLFDVD